MQQAQIRERTRFQRTITNKLLLRILLIIEVILYILWNIGLGFTLSLDFDSLIFVIVFAFHYAATFLAFALLEKVKECEKGMCKVYRSTRFMWMLTILTVMTSDVYSTIHFFMHTHGHFHGYHYLIAVMWITALVLDFFYFILAVTFRK